MNKTAVVSGPLAAILAVSMVLTPAFASWASITDGNDAANDDFDINQVGITDGGNLRMTVFGTAGGTTPSSASQAYLVYAYVFNSNAGLIAVTSHQAEDSAQVGNDLEWHTHRVTLDTNNCVSTIEDFGQAKLSGSRIDVLGTGATSVAGALTAQLTITPDKPHTSANEFSVCVTGVFDST